MTENPLPRELVSGVHWLGDCLAQPYQGKLLHGYNSAYLVCGTDRSALVEAGHPQDLPAIESQLERLLATGLPPLEYVFTTHQETPHAGGIGRLLTRYPDAVVCGDVRDFHLAFPVYEDRLVTLKVGDAIDLGGTSLVMVDAVIRDYISTLWAFDTARGVLFPGDGFAYSHYHEDGHCGKTAEEAPTLNLPDMTALFAQLALHWTRFTDMTPYVDRLKHLVFDELRVTCIAPTHGLPIMDLAATLPHVFQGLHFGSEGHTATSVY